MTNQMQSNEALTIAQALQIDSKLHSLSMNTDQLLHETIDRIEIRDLTQLLTFILHKNYAFIRTYPDFQLSIDQAEQFFSLKKKLESGTPLAYILGTQAFWTLDLKVTADTLIPRPDTEIIIVTILDILPKTEALNVIDMGTGTGAIALSIARECPSWKVTATDFSAGALTVAAENAQTHGLNHIRFLHGSWFDALPKYQNNELSECETFDLIVSNPPYIDPDDVHLADLKHEPFTALVAQDKGLSDLKIIVSKARDHLNPEGLLILEHGYNQGKIVRDLMKIAGLVSIKTVRDYGGNERVTLGRKNTVPETE